MAVDLVPAYVTLDVWEVDPRHVPSAALAMVFDRRAVSRSAGLTFYKLLGTGDGRTFDVRDADPRHWALLACWSDERAVAAFERSEVVGRWARRGVQHARVVMRPVSSRGSWSEREPFGDPQPYRPAGPVAAITRASLRARTALTFWRAVPPVAARVAASPGLVTAFGIGEAPVGVQGTFSLWRSADALEEFAYRSTEHVRAIRRTSEVGWYREQLFARLEVLAAHGTLHGAELDSIGLGSGGLGSGGLGSGGLGSGGLAGTA